MARIKDEVKKAESIDLLQQEIARLNQVVAEQEAVRESMARVSAPHDLASEMQKIRTLGKSQANSITITEKIDHQNVTLWTKNGMPVGPLHPDNAIQTLNRCASIGVYLSATKPSPEAIQAYCQSPEFKRKQKIEAEKRAIKDKTRKGGQLDRLANEIAKLAGTKVDEINKVLKSHEVRPLSEVAR